MTLDEVYKSIGRYLDSDRHTPRLVDVPSREVEQEVILKYTLPHNIIWWAEIFCHDDMLPAYDMIKNKLAHASGNIFLFGLSTFLKLEGRDKLVETFKSLLEQETQGKVVIVSLGCGSMFRQALDRRLFDSYQVMMVDGTAEKNVQFEFVERKLSANFGLIAEGLNKVDMISERGGDDEIFIRTSHKKTDFPNSLIGIRECSCTYDLLRLEERDLEPLPKEVGTDEQWTYLLKEVNACEGWSNYVDKTFGGVSNLKQCLINSADYDGNKIWALFVALKIHGAAYDRYLSKVIAMSDSADELRRNLYLCILDMDRNDKLFRTLYDQRKELLKAVCGDIAIVSDFCKQAMGKGAEALYYLTNMSQKEEEQIVCAISRHPDAYDRQNLVRVLGVVYPQLAAYLQRFDYKNHLLNSYFNEYKFCKVLNRISDALRSLVDSQATARDYNSILQPRATYVDKLRIDNRCAAYFVDALSVEYLSYLQQQCHDRGMLMAVSIGRCELPSVTEFNKEFLDAFDRKGVHVANVKDMDELMHEDTTNFDYEHTKEPIHISGQLKALDRLMDNVMERLCNGKTDRAYLLSDHGATRMPVINDRETRVEVSGGGLHSGRCCLEAEVSERPENAAEENGYWCLANYDRFKGGRMTGVEVHGGATLEEVCVPVITITKADNTVECKVVSNPVEVSFKKKARIIIYVSKELPDLSVSVDGGEAHKAQKGDKPYQYTCDIPELKKAGAHEATVYSGDNMIATGLKFEVKKEGASERKFF